MDVRVIRIGGPYTGIDAAGWHLFTGKVGLRESVGGGPFRSYADAMAVARSHGWTVTNEFTATPYGRHADDVDAAIEQVNNGE